MIAEVRHFDADESDQVQDNTDDLDYSGYGLNVLRVVANIWLGYCCCLGYGCCLRIVGHGERFIAIFGGSLFLPNMEKKHVENG